MTPEEISEKYPEEVIQLALDIIEWKNKEVKIAIEKERDKKK